MKNQVSIVAVIAVAAVAALGLNAYAVFTPASLSDGLVGQSMALGHVEMVVRDTDGNIKGYFQGDNVVTDDGDACVSQKIFGDATNSTACNGTGTANPFNYIGIINGSGFSPSSTTTNTGHFTAQASSGVALMAIVDAVATVPDIAGSEGTATTITNSAHTFNFDGSNDTQITGVILTDNACTEATNGGCSTLPTDMGVFAARTATLSVNDGDSLTVTWTITIGNAS